MEAPGLMHQHDLPSLAFGGVEHIIGVDIVLLTFETPDEAAAKKRLRQAGVGVNYIEECYFILVTRPEPAEEMVLMFAAPV